MKISRRVKRPARKRQLHWARSHPEMGPKCARSVTFRTPTSTKPRQPLPVHCTRLRQHPFSLRRLQPRLAAAWVVVGYTTDLPLAKALPCRSCWTSCIATSVEGGDKVVSRSAGSTSEPALYASVAQQHLPAYLRHSGGKPVQSEVRRIRKLYQQLVRAKRVAFPESRKALSAPTSHGVYVIYGSRGATLHVGRTVSGRRGLRQRLNNHLQGQSSFTAAMFGRKGARLRRSHSFAYVEVSNARRRALLEAYAVGNLCPRHVGTGSS